MTESTPRWRVGLLVALIASTLAVVTGLPALFLVGLLALGFTLIGSIGTPPNAPSLRVRRHIDDTRPDPGHTLSVTLEVTNPSDRVLPDVRVVDSPPAAMAHIEGSTAVATTLLPGETVQTRYTLRSTRGEFEFADPRVRLRPLLGTAHSDDRIEVEGQDVVVCESFLDTLPRTDQTIRYVGDTPTSIGGSGVEFFATREYRPGDPVNLIDWHRYARSGELATTLHREEHTVTLVCLVDDRPHVQRTSPSGCYRSSDVLRYAASRVVIASLEAGNRTGYATIDDDRWIEPTGRRDLLERIDGIDHRAMADGGSSTDSLLERLPENAQLAVCSPVTDDGIVDLLSHINGHGHDITVFSPNLSDSTSGTLGERIAAVERRNRIESLRRTGCLVVDWDIDHPLSVEAALTRPGPGWIR